MKITIDRSLVEQVLEFLYAEFGWNTRARTKFDALRAALAEPVQEPVAWDVYADFIKWKWRGVPNHTTQPQRPAQPVQELPWLRAIDEAMIDHHVGVADPADDYETAKRKLNNLLCHAQDIGAHFAKQADPVQELADIPLEDALSKAYYFTEEGKWRGSKKNEWDRWHAVAKVAVALTQKQAEPVQEQCKGDPGECEFNGGCMYACAKPEPLCAAPPQPPAEPVSVTDLQQALIETNLIDPDAIDDPEGYDAGFTVAQIDALHGLLFKSQRQAETDTDCHAQGICQRSGYSIGQSKPLSYADALRIATEAIGRLKSTGPVEGLVGLVRAVEAAHGIGKQE